MRDAQPFDAGSPEPVADDAAFLELGIPAA
jgi:hypothetical protein